MAHTYVINAPIHLGDVVNITGTVDGVAVSTNCPSVQFFSFPNVNAQISFTQSLMLAAVPPSPVAIPGIAGTYTV
jgi:hypothetical protein